MGQLISIFILLALNFALGAELKPPTQSIEIAKIKLAEICESLNTNLLYLCTATDGESVSFTPQSSRCTESFTLNLSAKDRRTFNLELPEKLFANESPKKLIFDLLIDSQKREENLDQLIKLCGEKPANTPQVNPADSQKTTGD